MADEKRPGAHAVQCVSALPELEWKPLGQKRHLDWPWCSWKVPPEQEVQCSASEAVSFMYSATSQAEQFAVWSRCWT